MSPSGRMFLVLIGLITLQLLTLLSSVAVYKEVKGEERPVPQVTSVEGLFASPSVEPSATVSASPSASVKPKATGITR